jgi:hypothetical protein
MSYIAEIHRSTGDLITAAIYNQAVSDNPAAIYAGAMSIASQAAGDVLYATSATQLGRVNGSGLLQLNGASAPTAWPLVYATGQRFVSYTTGSGVATFTVSGLDLNTDLAYDILILTGLLSGAGDSISARINNDATADQNWNAHTFGSTTASTFTSANGATTIVLTGTTTISLDWAIKLRLRLTRDGRPNLSAEATSTYDASGNGSLRVNSSGSKNATTNVTSIRFYTASATCNWKVYVSKAAQS